MSFFPRELAAPVVEAAPAIEWEEPDCLLCGSREWSPLVESPDTTAGGTGLWFAVVQCQRCGLCFTNPRPSPETIGRFYPSIYRPHRTPRQRQQRLLDRLRFWRRPKRGNLKILWRGEGRLLDFGCGGGAFLARMHSQGWQVTGVDVSPAAVDCVRRQGLRVFLGTLPHGDLEPSSFEVITMWHSLEHVHFPLEVLREAHRLLVPGGQLFIAVPNIDSLPFRWFGSAWYGLDLPRHLTHFAPWTLQLMLERAGFQIGPTTMVRHSQWLRSSARLACQTGKGTFWHRLLTAKPPSRLASRYCHLVQQSDCIMVSAER